MLTSSSGIELLADCEDCEDCADCENVNELTVSKQTPATGSLISVGWGAKTSPASGESSSFDWGAES